MSQSPVRRPGGVTLLGVLVVISGILYVLSGIIALVAVLGVSANNQLTSSQSTAALITAIVILLVGIVELAVARGLFRGSPGARTIVAIVNVLTIISGLYAAFAAGNQRGTSIGQVVIAIIVLALLYSPKANEFFGSARSRVTY